MAVGLRRGVLVAWCAVGAALGAGSAWGEVAAAPYAEYRVKAEFLERFTHFIEWPAEGLPPEDQPFVIGVLGTDGMTPHLENLARTRRIKGRLVVVQQLRSAEEVLRCQVVWIARSEAERLDSILARTTGRPILTVADTASFSRHGVHITVTPVGSRLGFLINVGEAARSGLSFSAHLLRLGAIVETRIDARE
ncbi:MAG: YfiR family protein [Myxococcota bacterium]